MLRNALLWFARTLCVGPPHPYTIQTTCSHVLTGDNDRVGKQSVCSDIEAELMKQGGRPPELMRRGGRLPERLIACMH